MYFDAKLTIDPSQITELHHVKPSKAFGRLFYYLTAGRTGDDEEVETFTAVSILQQLNMAMRSLRITNIVRLARDGRDYYLDTTGRDDDLGEALAAFESRASREDLAPFASLKLVLEHTDDTLRYLLQVDVHRAHAVGRDPLQVRVSAVLGGFAGSTRAEVEPALAPIFGDQARYDAFVAQRRAHFDAFLVRLSTAIQGTIPADKIGSAVTTCIVRPRERVEDVARIKTARMIHGEDDDEWAPLFHGYAGFDTATLYAWAWTELAHAHRIRLRDFTLVDETGRTIAVVGAQGFDAGAAEALAPGAEMGALPGDDVRYAWTHAYGAKLADLGLVTAPTAPAEDARDAGWLGGMFEGGAHVGEHRGDGEGGSGCGGCSGS
jgi:hypothetical protein